MNIAKKRRSTRRFSYSRRRQKAYHAQSSDQPATSLQSQVLEGGVLNMRKDKM
jgi:hypothetical protein